MKILITGAKGMLGSELNRQLKQKHQVTAYDFEELDITNSAAVYAKISELRPEIIFNCAAYNNVDKAEEEKELAFKLNVDGPRNLALAADQIGSTIVHFSTGFIFDGAKPSGYAENAPADPQSVYAKSKLEGEKEVTKIAKKFYIVRLNLLFGEAPKNSNAKKSFPDLILDLSKEKKEFDFVTDEISTPTYAPDLAAATIALVLEKKPYGIYHLPNEGKASWYDFAQEVFRIKGVTDVTLNPVTHDKYPRPAKRPEYSILLNTKLPKQRSWQEALNEYLNRS